MQSDGPGRWRRLLQRRAMPRFYHGTSLRYWPVIQQHGLLAGPTRPLSGPVRHGVYLTDQLAVAAGYAALACDRLADSRGDERLVFEVLRAALDPALLQPDDDDLHDAIISPAAAHDPRLCDVGHWQHVPWRLSLAVIHQVLYAGAIPLSALRRVISPPC